MVWQVRLTTKVRQGLKKLPPSVEEIVQLLFAEIKHSGPLRRNWPHYGKLRQDCYHCHLQKGRPTYVAVWRVISKIGRFIEVTYVGTHEKAHYDRLC